MFSLSQVIKIQQQKEEEEEEKKEDEEKKKKKKKRRRERRDRRRQKKKNNKKMNEGNTLPKTYTNTAQTKNKECKHRETNTKHMEKILIGLLGDFWSKQKVPSRNAPGWST